MQEIAFRLFKQRIIIPLKSQPSLLRRPNLLKRVPRLLFTNKFLLVPILASRRINKELCPTRSIKTHKPKRSFINTLANCKKPMIPITSQLPDQTNVQEHHSKIRFPTAE